MGALPGKYYTVWSMVDHMSTHELRGDIGRESAEYPAPMKVSARLDHQSKNIFGTEEVLGILDEMDTSAKD